MAIISGCGAAGSALDWGSRGREFKSRHSDHVKTLVYQRIRDIQGIFFYAFFAAGDYKVTTTDSLIRSNGLSRRTAI